MYQQNNQIRFNDILVTAQTQYCTYLGTHYEYMKTGICQL